MKKKYRISSSEGEDQRIMSKIFRTNKASLMLLKLTYELYRLENTVENKAQFTCCIKMNLYNLIVDISLILLILVSSNVINVKNDTLHTNMLILLAGIFFLNIINEAVIQIYLNKKDAYEKAEVYAMEILNNAPEFAVFNDNEKRFFFKLYVKKMRK